MNCTVYAAWTLNFHFEQITTSLSKLEKSSWMKAEQAFEHEIRERPTSSATNFESSRSLKLWKSESFGSSQSSQTDSFVVDWSRCFICQVGIIYI